MKLGALAFAAFAAFFALLFPDVVFRGYSFMQRDIVAYYHPVWHYVSGLWRQGIVPLWNPLAACGVPLQANVQSCVFYPVSLLLAFGDFTYLFNLYILLHLTLAGFFTYLWMRDIGCGHTPSAYAGFTYAMSGYMLSAVNLTISLCSAVYLPLALLCFRRSLGERARRWTVATSGVLLLQFLAGDPAVLFGTFFVLLFFACARAFNPVTRGQAVTVLPLARLLAAAALFAGLSAFQSLPFAELLLRSDRLGGLSVAEKMRWSMPLADMIGFVVPGFGKLSMFRQDYWMRQSWLENYYMGASVGVLILAGITAVRTDRRVALHAGIAAVGLIFALGRYSPVFVLLHRYVPLLGFVRYPIRFLFIFSFAGACLAGLGLRSMSEPSRRGPDRKLELIYALTLGLTVVSFVWFMPLAQGFSHWAYASFYEGMPKQTLLPDREVVTALLAVAANARRSLLIAALTVTALVAARQARVRPQLPLALLWLVTFADLTFTNVTEPRVQAWHMKRPQGHLSRVSADPEPGRVMASPKTFESCFFLASVTPEDQLSEQKHKFAPNVPLQFGVSDLLVYDSIFTPETDLIRDLAAQAPERVRARTLGWMNVKYVTSPNGSIGPGFSKIAETAHAKLFKNERVMPRAFFARRALVERDRSRLFMALFDEGFDPTRTVYIEHEIAQTPGDDGPGRGTVVFERDEPGRVSLKVSSAADQWLVLADAYHPAWRATVDSRDVTVERANGAFRAVRIEAGEHRVQWRFEPDSLKFGALISLLTAAAALLGRVAR